MSIMARIDKKNEAGGVPVYYRDGRFATSDWKYLLDDEAVTARSILPMERFLSDSRPCDGAIGALVRPGEDVARLENHLADIMLIAIEFPAFTDGRGYSSARILRDRFGFSGEIRAAGDILFDQIPFMLRCGIDSFEITNLATRKLLQKGHEGAMKRFLQPAITAGGEQKLAGEGATWLRRISANSN